ncbi:calcitonin receptor [Echinops telfairi]|uniref:Calcitonin receptor n=1 Tax=Echinops telfairi TaxID=9371 RepID=A0ABM0ILL0_ECHTE|nr:calcitonin receptor [Echinops telfairi]
MKFSITNQCIILFIFLNHPTPILPSNDTYPVAMDAKPTPYAAGRQKMSEAQYQCYDRMKHQPPYKGEGPYCNRTWDGWMCWDDTPAGAVAYQFCPDYFPDFDPAERVTKYCDENGDWFKHPDDNQTWSNYSLCNAFVPENMNNAYVLYYLAIVGHSLSIITLVISLAIFMFFKSLSCQRVTLHKNMFLTYILNSIIIIVHLIEVVPSGELVKKNPISCKILHFFHQYMMACNYFWMLCEGIYLHTLIVVCVFTEEQRLKWYYLLGWGFPLLPTTIHAITRAIYFNDNCWLSAETHLLYIIHGPVMAALVVNFFFLLNIVRVLVTKMRETHEQESHMYLKAVRATLILVPLLGIQFVVFPWRPSNKILGKIYDYFMHALIHFQGFFVASIYCFSNNEVQTTLKRQWGQFKIQWQQRWGGFGFGRSAPNPRPRPPPTGHIAVYICRERPRNNEEGGLANIYDGAEMVSLNLIERRLSA